MLEKIIIYVSSYRILLLELGENYSNVIGNETVNFDNLAKLINLNKIKTYLLFSSDFSSQKFITKSFPFISYANIKSLINLVKAENRALNFNISDYFFISSKNNKFYYSFIFDNIPENILLFINKIQNTFQGIYFNSLESNYIVHEIFSHTDYSRTDNLLLLYTYPNNIMIIRTDENFITSYAYIKKLDHNTRASIAGEILQIIDDLTDQNKTVSIGIIIPQEIKVLIMQERNDRITVLLTPYEAAIILRIENLIKSEEEFADLIFIKNIILNKKSFCVFPTILKKKFYFRKYSALLNYSIISIALFCFISFAFLNKDLKTKTLKDKIISSNLKEVKKKFRLLNADLKHYSEQSQEKIQLYKIFDGADFSVIERIKKFNDSLDIKKLRLNLSDDIGEEKVDIQISGKPKFTEKQAKDEINNDYTNYQTSFYKNNDEDLHIKIEK
jgi:hypothetical protein